MEAPGDSSGWGADQFSAEGQPSASPGVCFDDLGPLTGGDQLPVLRLGSGEEFSKGFNALPVAFGQITDKQFKQVQILHAHRSQGPEVIRTQLRSWPVLPGIYLNCT
nr:hypothetical protein [Nesterenkonia sedimenti]